MRLLQFVDGGKQRVGVELKQDGDIIDISAFDPSIPSNMKSFLEDKDRCLAVAKRAIESGKHLIKRCDVQLKAPVTNPQKVIGIGMNYTDHCEEQNAPIPELPIVFSKFPSSIQDPYGPIIHPAESKTVDWEVELAIIIGKHANHVKESEAMDYIAGYTVAHDVSARDLQLHSNSGQWLLGKAFDTFCPIGPVLVTPDGLTDPHKLGIRCRVNGQTMQNSTTANMIFRTPYLVAYVSKFCSLEPGDVIVTGTPPGVGCFRKPPIFLKVGDVVECEIDEIGCIKNEIVAPKAKM